MFFTFLIVVILTAIALVVAAMTIAKLIAPRRSIHRRESLMNVESRHEGNHGYSLR